MLALLLAVAACGMPHVAARLSEKGPTSLAPGTFSDAMALGEARLTVWDAPAYRLISLATAVVERDECPEPHTSVGGYLVLETRVVQAFGLFGIPVATARVDCRGEAALGQGRGASGAV